MYLIRVLKQSKQTKPNAIRWVKLKKSSIKWVKVRQNV